MEKLLEMKREFASLTKQLRDAEKEEAPDKAKVEKIAEEIRSLASRIDAEEAILRMIEGVTIDTKPKVLPGTNTDGDVRSRDEYRFAFERYVRAGTLEEFRSMNVTTSAKGGVLVPTDWEKAIVEKRQSMSVLRTIADVQVSSLDKDIPVEASNGASSWVDEEGEYQVSDEEFATKTMQAHKYGRIILVSEELLEDEQYNLQAYLTNKGAKSNAALEEAAFVSGDGTKKPRGFLLDADIGVTTATTAGLSYDELLDLWGSLKTVYARFATWVMSRSTLVAVMKLKDGNGQYIYHPSTQPGELGMLFGRPVVLADDMPAIGAGNKPIAFGDFSYYRIQDRAGATMKRLDELYAKTGQIGFRFRQRTDGKLLVPEAVKVLAIKAA